MTAKISLFKEGHERASIHKLAAAMVGGVRGEMQVVYTGEEMPETFTRSIFLAGPTPRNKEEQPSWRPEALQRLKEMGYDGVVFVPEGRDGHFRLDYDDQVGWEEKYLNVADCIVFWVPRDISLDSKGYPKMAAFTTNVEFGAWADSGKIVYGGPSTATKNGYLKHYAGVYNAPIAEHLDETLALALDMLDHGSKRTGGERFVPLFIWRQQSFQDWYQTQTAAGNRLDEARLLYSFRPSFKKFVFMWVLKAKIFVASENRYKENEIVISRPSISSVCLYCLPSDGATTREWEVVVVKEFRSPSSFTDGFVREFPGGSSVKGDPLVIASEEVFEETGFQIDPLRLKSHGSRPLAGTFSAHQGHLFSAELTRQEMNWFKSQQGIAYGNEADSERTFIEVYTIDQLIEKELVDWTTLGMMLAVFNS